MEPPGHSNKHDERLLRYAVAVGIVLALVCLGYLEENWRGRHEWNRLKQNLEAHGGRVDWTNYIPTPVPDDKNFYGAEKMQQWFVGRGGVDLTERLNRAGNDFLDQHTGAVVAEITVVKPGEKIVVKDADIVLEYDDAINALGLSAQKNSLVDTNEAIPLILMTNVPVIDAINHLARAGGLVWVLDPQSKPNQLASLPPVTGRWEGATARDVLGVVLKNNRLKFVPNSKNGVGLIVPIVSGQREIAVEPAAKEQLEELLVKVIGSATNRFDGKCSYTAMGIMLSPQASDVARPVRVVLRAKGAPSPNELAAFFPVLPNAYYPVMMSRPQATAISSNVFQIRMQTPVYMSAAEYLTWSENLEPDFDLIREAVKRLYAQLKGDYRIPASIPIPNFVTHRIVAQTLTDRAKCHLVLGQSEAALQDLTLVRELCRVMEGRPRARPLTLVAAMIDTAITALYTEVVAEGIRLHAWHEPELAALEEQLKHVDLPPLLAESFTFERASSCRVVETINADQFVTTVGNHNFGNPAQTNLWSKLKNPTYLLFKTGPRGWVYQNMSKIAELDGKLLDALNTGNGTVSASKTESATKQMMADLEHFSLYNFLAKETIANFSRAVQTMTRNQCAADEARVAIALERYRLARGGYPTELASLVPQYLDKVPMDIVSGQPLKYRVNAEGRFALYSVGWNGKDDGGVAGPEKHGSPDIEKGDWVWAGSSR